jgi:PmbA protein
MTASRWQGSLSELAAQVVQIARDAGAAEAECTIEQGEEFSAGVRLGELETLKQASSQGAGLRILVGQRTGSAYTSDLTPLGIQKLTKAAMELAEITTEDPFAGLPDAADLGAFGDDLGLYHPDVEALETNAKIDMARRAEAAALATDPRVTNSDGGSFGTHLGRRAFANSRGFAGEYRSTYCSLSAVPIAKQDGRMERDYWYSTARGSAGLETPEFVGRRAAERVVRRLGAVKVETQNVPVIFEPRVARSMLQHLFDGVQGRNVYRNASFLAGSLGKQVAAKGITVIDDGTLPGRFGSAPFDDEGVATRRTVVVEDGLLKSYLLNTYSARKLGMRSTGNAARGITGNAGTGHGNLYFEPGARTPEELIGSVSNGFYVTELIGSGANVSTGDYSCGAAGLWIRNGELAFAVAEVTIASTLQEMLCHMEVANDLEFRGSVSAPTVLIQEMTVAGK